MGQPPPGALVVVPHRPGPLIDMPTEAPRRRDELDELIEELFGEPTDEGPGPFDAVMVAGGGALAVTAMAAHLAGVWIVAGCTAAGLGLVLPLRAVWQRAMRRRNARKLAGLLQQGTPLNVAHPATRRLADAYRTLVAATATGAGLDRDALEAGHLALVEVAGLLGGREPHGPAEQEYVAARAGALEQLTPMLGHTSAATVCVRGDADHEPAVRDAAVDALRDFEERTGISSVAAIEALRAVLAKDPR